MSKINNFVFYTTITFAIIGVLFLGITVHEFVHAYDYSIFNYSDANICLFKLGNVMANDPIGSFTFHLDSQFKEEYTQISKYAEYKAYGLMAVFMAITLFIIIHYVFETKWDDWTSKAYQPKDLNTQSSSI